MIDQDEKRAVVEEAYTVGMTAMMIFCIGSLFAGLTAPAAVSWFLAVFCWFGSEGVRRVVP